MIDENTQEPLQVVQPQLDEQLALDQAQFMETTMQEQMQEPVQMGEEEAGLTSEIAKTVSKLIGRETASDVADVTAKTTAQAMPKEAVKVDTSFTKSIAQKLISKDKVKPIAQPKPKIGEMVQKIPKQQVAEEARQTARINNFEQGNSFIANDINVEKEMLGLRESDIDQFDTNDAWQLNFDTIRDDEDLGSTLAYMAEQNQALIQAERGESGTNEHILKLANDVGADPDFVNNVLSWENGGALPSSGYVMAVRQMLDASSTKLKQLAMIPDNELSPQNRADFIAQYDFHRRFQAKYMGIRAELSRSFRAIGIPYGDEDLASFLAHSEGGLDIKKLRKAIAGTETTKGINDLVNKYAGNNEKWTSDMFYTSYMGSILSGVGTQFLVAFGGATNMVSRIAERKIAPFIPSFRGDDTVAREEFDIMMSAYKSSFLDGTKAFWKTFSTGEAYKGIGNFGEYQDLPLPSEQFKLSGIGAKLADSAFRGTQFMMRNVMGGTDAFFRVINERAELSTLAYRQAKGDLEAGKITPEMFENHLKNIIENPTQDMTQKAEIFGREIGMQEPAGDIAMLAHKLSKEITTGRYLIPFINTLSNQIRQTLGERTPIAMLRNKFWEDINAGGTRGQLALTKMATGTAFGATMFGLAEDGRLTGAMPNDKATRDAWKEAGIKPYSFVFRNDDGTNTYVSYQGLEPFATILGIAATLSDYNQLTLYQELTKNDEDKMNNIFGDFMYAISETTLNKTFATGLQNFFDAVQSPKDMERLVGSFANGIIPFAGLRRNIVKAFDDVKRDTDGIFESIQSQIPLLSDAITPVLDIFGEERTHEVNMMRWYPIQSTDDPVKQEIVNLNEVVGRMAIGEFKDAFGGQSASPQERYRWLKYARKDRTDANGDTLHDVLLGIIQSDYYQELSSFDKVKEISSTVRAWDTAALQELQEDDPELYERMSSKKAAQDALYLIEKENMGVEDALQQAKQNQQDQYLGE